MNINCQIKNELYELLKYKSCLSVSEICGFIIKNNNVFDTFIECKNMHPDHKNYFLISPHDYILDQDVILFHSHPKHCDINGFSDWDIENQSCFCLKMLLYSVNKDKFYYRDYD